MYFSFWKDSLISGIEMTCILQMTLESSVVYTKEKPPSPSIYLTVYSRLLHLILVFLNLLIKI